MRIHGVNPSNLQTIWEVLLTAEATEAPSGVPVQRKSHPTQTVQDQLKPLSREEARIAKNLKKMTPGKKHQGGQSESR
jgi:hypothetical protein